MDPQDEIPFHIVSPLKESLALSKVAGTQVLMKLENIQPLGSFKIRGIGHFCQKVWDDADAYAHRLTEAPGSVYISPFNHPLLWEGHSSLILELKASLGNQKPGALVVSVGGGGLLAGLVEGMVKVGWSDVPIIAMETVGAHCLNAALQAGRPVSLPDITSIAKCLGAKTVCDRALECAKKYKVISVTVDDKDALEALEMFLEDELMLVEAACGAALAAVYSGHIQRLQKEGKLEQLTGPLIMIVCGGSSISLSELQNFKSQLGMV